jgi:hypothetical protein
MYASFLGISGAPVPPRPAPQAGSSTSGIYDKAGSTTSGIYDKAGSTTSGIYDKVGFRKAQLAYGHFPSASEVDGFSTVSLADRIDKFFESNGDLKS